MNVQKIVNIQKCHKVVYTKNPEYPEKYTVQYSVLSPNINILVNIQKTSSSAPSVGNLGPRLCTQHFREDDIIKTRVGIRLKSNVVPMIGIQRQMEDFRDDIEVISGDGILFKFNKAHLVAMCPALRTIIASCEEETPKLLFDDVDTETVQSFYDMLHLGEACLNGNQRLRDLKKLLVHLGVDQDQLSDSVIESFQIYNEEFISRHQLQDDTIKDSQ